MYMMGEVWSPFVSPSVKQCDTGIRYLSFSLYGFRFTFVLVFQDNCSSSLDSLYFPDLEVYRKIVLK